MNEDRKQHRQTHEVVSELTRRGIYHGQKGFSDIYPAEQGRCAGFGETRFLVNQAIRWELRAATLSNPNQTEAVFGALRADGWLFEPSPASH